MSGFPLRYDFMGIEDGESGVEGLGKYRRSADGPNMQGVQDNAFYIACLEMIGPV